MDTTVNENKPLKLNYPKTFKVGIAFAIICLFWNAYDFVIPLLLEKTYGLSNSMRGLIMGLDNLLSLFLLPIFGKISDKGKGKLVHKLGRRTPYILIGTLITVVLMIFVPIAARSQLERSTDIRQGYEAQLADDAFMTERLTYFYEQAESGKTAYCDLPYLNTNDISKADYVAIRKYATEDENGEKITLTDAQKESNSRYSTYVSSGMNVWISEQVNTAVHGSTAGNTSLVFYMIILLFVLLAMATFRSPAVALMPDVTPKPLRSQANAIINLCGGVGGAISFIIYTVALIKETLNTYIIIFCVMGVSMVGLLFAFLKLVDERKLVKECADICEEYGINDEDEKQEEKQNEADGAEDLSVPVPAPSQKMDKAKKLSFILILASIFMWFMGYNAVSSNLSVYCVKALNLSASVASIVNGISMAVSAIAFIPVGILAVKIGRRKSIMLGWTLAVVSFILLFLFVKPNENTLLPAALFSLFYLIAGFGLIIANVNTFPMVVELSDSGSVGKFTGYYYTATMSAQAITPYVAGLFMDGFGMRSLFAYSAVCVMASIVLMIFVKHGDSKQLPTHKLTKEEKKQIALDSMGDAD